MAALREPTRRRLYQYVERQPEAVSRDEAAEAIGISRALAAFHLDKLVEVGVLKPEYRRLSGRTGPGAGRTSKLYRRSRNQFAVSLPHRDHELLARLLAASIDSSAEDAPAAADSPAAEPARAYGRSLGRRARKRLRGDPGPARHAGLRGGGAGEPRIRALSGVSVRGSTSELPVRSPVTPVHAARLWHGAGGHHRHHTRVLARQSCVSVARSSPTSAAASSRCHPRAASRRGPSPAQRLPQLAWHSSCSQRLLIERVARTTLSRVVDQRERAKPIYLEARYVSYLRMHGCSS